MTGKDIQQINEAYGRVPKVPSSASQPPPNFDVKKELFEFITIWDQKGLQTALERVDQNTIRAFHEWTKNNPNILAKGSLLKMVKNLKPLQDVLKPLFDAYYGT